MQLGRDAKQEEALRLPQQPSRRQPWILAALRSSTKGLKTLGAAVRALEQVNKTLGSMQPGLEQSHLLWMLKHVDARGSDVELVTGELSEPIRHTTPYLAPAWIWRTY